MQKLEIPLDFWACFSLQNKLLVLVLAMTTSLLQVLASYSPPLQKLFITIIAHSAIGYIPKIWVEM